jgi:hypothetical protein
MNQKNQELNEILRLFPFLIPFHKIQESENSFVVHFSSMRFSFEIEFLENGVFTLEGFCLKGNSSYFDFIELTLFEKIDEQFISFFEWFIN